MAPFFIILSLLWAAPVCADAIDFSKERLSDRYAVSLRSSKAPFDESAIPDLDLFRTHRLYTTKEKKGAIVWHRLRLGFFPTKRSAQKALDSLADAYPHAWIAKVTKAERVASAKTAISFKLSFSDFLQRSKTKLGKKIYDIKKESGEKISDFKGSLKEKRRLAVMRKDAEKAMNEGDYVRAVKLYQDILRAPKHSFQRKAKELLGLAYEGRKWKKNARRVYNEYLKLYPSGSGTERVRKRLAALDSPQPKKRAPSTVSPGKVDTAHQYAVNLVSSRVPIDRSAIPDLAILKKHRLYTTRIKSGGVVWHRLRLGFFSTERSARKARSSLRKSYPDAWVAKVSKNERVASARSAIAVGAPPVVAVKPGVSVKSRVAELFKGGRDAKEEVEDLSKAEREAAKKRKKKVPTTPSEKQQAAIAKLMKKAERAMTRGKFDEAMTLYKRVLEYPDKEYRRDAMEYLAVAYERKGNLEAARAIYKRYLTLYPKEKGAPRVRQRLAGIETAAAKPKKKLQKVKRKKTKGTDFYGSLSQLYNRDESYTDLGSNSITRSTLSTDLDLNIRRRGNIFDFRTVLIGGHSYNFITDGEANEYRLNRFYFDLSDKRRVVTARVGRQSRSTGGVLGRYDGGLLTYALVPKVKINLVGGFPVESSVVETIDTDKHFYGASIDLGTFFKHWDGNVYYIEQKADGVNDRQAVGGEIRYFSPKRYFFYLVDYDISYSELNTILFVGNWTLPDKSTVNLSVDYRRSPIIRTSNALQGQIELNLTDLLLRLSEEEVRGLALDRTSISKSVTLGYTRPLSDTKFQLSSDMTLSELEGTEASGGVEAVPGTGVDYYFSTQLIGTSLIKEGDTAIVGLRYSKTSTAQTISLNVNTRYPATRSLRVNPRVRVDYRQGESGSDDRWVVRPSFRTDYYWRKRKFHFEFEAGGDLTYSTFENTRDYFLLAGYRLDF